MPMIRLEQSAHVRSPRTAVRFPHRTAARAEARGSRINLHSKCLESTVGALQVNLRKRDPDFTEMFRRPAAPAIDSHR